jgi:hypothetical protein
LCVYRKGTPVKKSIEVYKIQPKISDNMWWDFFYISVCGLQQILYLICFPCDFSNVGQWRFAGPTMWCPND